MRNVKMTLAYDGTDFHGWQTQQGLSTIQGTLNDVLERLTQQRVNIQGAGRTDAGVHAAGQVAHFNTESELSAEKFQRAFNALLPDSIRVLSVEDVCPEFHSRWSASAKTYRYRIYRGRIMPPFLSRYVLHSPAPLDFEAMREAAHHFEAEHDFTSFAAAAGTEEEDRRRTMTRVIYSSHMCKSGESVATDCDEEWHYVVRGKSFLRYMVRNIVGTLIEIGRGKLKPSAIPRLFEQRDRSLSGPTMPPQGLCLMGIEYPKT
jgi:tRNA pseudouridine38-40 synthase